MGGVVTDGAALGVAICVLEAIYVAAAGGFTAVLNSKKRKQIEA